MNLLKKFGLVAAVFAFVMTLTVITANAQPGRAGWDRNNGRHRGWTQGRRNGWDRGRKTGWRRDRNWNDDRRYRRTYGNDGYYGNYGRLSADEYRRLQRQRYRIYRNQNRYYRNDGYLSDREQRRLNRQYNRYRRNVYRERRDW